MTASGDVTSYLNVTSARPEDGGRYTCRAHNARGVAEHSTRLNVYGPPSIRNVGPVRVVTGANATVHCPYSGFPISEIRWQRVGGGEARGAGGELRLWPVDAADAGLYSCRVTAPGGQYAQSDIQVFVRNPPKIASFSFPTDLVEGSSVQILCGITSGDKPIYFSWLKDGEHIPSSLGVQEKSLDEFSFLIFSHVTSKHSGEYTCVATNSAAEVNHTARLAVKVAPSWVVEPQDVSTLLGTQILVHCATKGYPEPNITWLKGHGSDATDFRPVSTVEPQAMVLSNGSLSLSPAARRHEGRYQCRADNGIGRGLAKSVSVSVNEPAHFEYSSRNMTVKRTAEAILLCDAKGDPPIQIQWAHNMKRVEFNSYRISASEKRSSSGVSAQLTIARAERSDSGVYRCRAENAYGRDELLIYLAVQEFPEAPRGLRVAWRGSRAATLAWRRGFDGNARVTLYRLQFRVVGDRDRDRADSDDWTLAPTRDIPADRVYVSHESGGAGGEAWLELRVEGLRPATAYALRLSAANAIGHSAYSDPVIAQTIEEAPSEPPHNVLVQATAPGELLVKWQAPAQESWNGELLGYAVTWREAGAGDNASRALAAAGWQGASASLAALRPQTHYEVRVRAFNAVGAGPPCSPLTATTLEGVPEAAPERVRCEPLSSQSIRVWWESPPAHSRGGTLLGYELLLEVLDDLESHVETRRSGSLETVLGSLQRATNYSVAVRARSSVGAGPFSEPVFCTTHEDIPGAPASIKAVASAGDSVDVSWLTPAHKNGRIKHYTVYTRPQRTGQHHQLSVAHREGETEFRTTVRGLLDAQLYEFWVTATSAAGEGEMSPVVARKPNQRAPAKISSFGRRIVAREGSRVRIACAAAGAPAPVLAWTRRRAAPPLAADPRFAIEGDTLVILSMERSVEDNYSCVARNPWGEDAASWTLKAVGVPGRPLLRLLDAAAASLRVSWTQPDTSHATVHGYTLQHSRSSDSRWQLTRLPGDARAHTLPRLSCGASYRLRLVAHNAIGVSEPSDELVVSTKGGLPKPSGEKQLLSANSTCVRLNLLTWDSNGCALERFVTALRPAAGGAWDTREWSAAMAALAPQELCKLRPAAWYQLKVVAHSAAGVAAQNYYFATLTEHGERIPAPNSFPPAEPSSRASAAWAAAGAALAASLLLLSVLAWRRSGAWCVRKGYEPGDGDGDSSSADDKHVTSQDGRRSCQQVYVSSPVKHGKKDHQEMYEISPYATFSMAGAGTGASTNAGTLRSCGRASAPGLGAGLTAAPIRGGMKTRSPKHEDEYTLSRAMTLLAHRSRSDSESSGSPCAECTGSASYRLPVTPCKDDVFRPVTDSSAESDGRSVATAAGVGGGAAAAGPGGGSGARHERERADKRRRHRRHHTPNNARYQPRQEQERRDFTIHV